MKKTKKLSILLVLALSCSSSRLAINEKYEGFNNSKLRIYLRINLSELSASIKTEKELKKEILKKAKERAFILLDNHIQTTGLVLARPLSPYKQIQTVLKNGKIFYYRIDEDNHLCETYIDYDTGNLLAKQPMTELKQDKRKDNNAK